MWMENRCEGRETSIEKYEQSLQSFKRHQKDSTERRGNEDAA